MSKFTREIRELISTPIKKKIFKAINSQKDGFTRYQLFSDIERKRLNVSIASIQNLLKSLSNRGYLEEHPLKETKTAGRSTIHYWKSRK